MLKDDMEEAKTGVVDVVDVEENTMKKLLEFIYTGKIEEMDNQLEMLLYAADKYEINGLVSKHMLCSSRLLISPFQIHLCKGALSQKDVTPKNATGILLLADRHSLRELKKVIKSLLGDSLRSSNYVHFQRVVAWILAEKEVYMADKTFTKEMEKHPALLMDLLKT